MLDFETLPILDPSADPLPDSLVNTVETIQFCVFCVTVPFYLFIIYFIIDGQSRNVNGVATPFFKLCLSTAVIDLLTLFTNYFGSMFPLWGWGINIYLYLDGIYTHTYYYIAWTVGINQAMCAAVLTANRVSAILFTHKYTRFWARKNLTITIVIQYAPGMILSCLTFFNEAQIKKTKKGGLVPRFKNATLTKSFFIMGGIYLISICLFLVGCYCYLFYAVRKRDRRSLTNHSQNDHSFQQAKSAAKRREFKLFIMSTIIVIVQFVLLLLFINKIFNFIILSSDGFQLIYNIICDIYSSINPYLLWIFSDTLRDYILIRIGIKKKKKITSSVITLKTVL